MSAITLPTPTAADVAPARPPRHRVLTTVGKIAAAVVVALVVSSCARRAPIPTSYGGPTSSVHNNFINGCTSNAHSKPVPNPPGGSPKSVCECEWAAIKKAYPNFSDFKAVNSQLTNHPGPLPPKMQDIVRTCNESS